MVVGCWLSVVGCWLLVFLLLFWTRLNEMGCDNSPRCNVTIWWQVTWESRHPAAPPPSSPRQVTHVSHRGLIPDVRGRQAKTVPVERLHFSAPSAHPDCWNLSLPVHGGEQRNGGCHCATTEMSTAASIDCNCGTTTAICTVRTVPSTCRCRTTALHRPCGKTEMSSSLPIN